MPNLSAKMREYDDFHIKCDLKIEYIPILTKGKIIFNIVKINVIRNNAYKYTVSAMCDVINLSTSTF